MKKQLGFIKTTVIGGIAVVLPLAFVVMLIDEAMQAIDVVATPIADALPKETLLGIPQATVVSFLLILMICFLMGSVFRPGPGATSALTWTRESCPRSPATTS